MPLHTARKRARVERKGRKAVQKAKAKSQIGKKPKRRKMSR